MQFIRKSVFFLSLGLSVLRRVVDQSIGQRPAASLCACSTDNDAVICAKSDLRVYVRLDYCNAMTADWPGDQLAVYFGAVSNVLMTVIIE